MDFAIVTEKEQSVCRRYSGGTEHFNSGVLTLDDQTHSGRPSNFNSNTSVAALKLECSAGKS